MEKKTSTGKKCEMVFAGAKEYDAYLPKDMSNCKDRGFLRLFSANTDEINGWFDGFRVESIEMTISSIINTDEGTKLIIGSNDNQGLNVVLKPKDGNTDTAPNDFISNAAVDNIHPDGGSR